MHANHGPTWDLIVIALNLNHAVSVQRTAALMKDLFGLSVSQAAVLKAAMTSAGILQPTVDAIGQG
jgi:transposase